MKVLHFSNNLNDGAGKVAYRLHKSLLAQGVESLMLVLWKDCADDTVIDLSHAHFGKLNTKSNKEVLRIFANFIDFAIRKFRWKLKSYKWKPFTLFNWNIAFVSINKIRKYLDGVDIICLHSIQGFLSPKLIRDIYLLCKVPIVWTPMDIEPLTGGCHFNNGCMNFTQSCGDCPQLAKRGEADISRHIWSIKKRMLEKVPITFVAGSSWAHNYIQKSFLFGMNRIESIFFGVNYDDSTKVEKLTARKILGIPKEKKVILFGAFDLNDKRKGGQYLLRALNKLCKRLETLDKGLSDIILLATMGKKDGFKLDELRFEWVHLGEVRDEKMLSLVYQASDLLACPSVDDFGPMIINEAFMHDIPIVSFNVGVASDLVRCKRAGYIAKNYCADDFSSGLYQSLFEHRDLREDGQKRLMEECKISTQACKYMSLFKELLVK